ncbi:MAG: hypothetical protein V3S89_04570, partial [Desulfobacterales bacterium]
QAFCRGTKAVEHERSNTTNHFEEDFMVTIDPQKLHDIDPDVRGIVATGYSNDPVVTHCGEYGFKGALTKPYTTYELSQVLSDVLSGE